MTSVVVIGAGIVGAACAFYAAKAGLEVTVIDRGGVAGGTTGAGEGNILVSDKEPSPELELALRSQDLWRALEFGGFEREPKGGLVVAESDVELEALSRLAHEQAAAGVTTVTVTDPTKYERHLRPGLAGGVFYPQDMQVQPMLAAARMLAESGAHLCLNTTVVRVEPGVVETDRGVFTADAIVNAAGVWAGGLPGLELPIMPRRGFVLVTGKAPGLVRHKVYAAGYVADVGSSSADLQTSPVVEGTQAGTILIGASRERVGFDGSLSLPVLRRLAAGAVRLFPVLGDVPVIRAYRGFRPYTPDHLPVIGADPRAAGVFHAAGHEGAGVGLAPATGDLIARLITGRELGMSVEPFSPARFL